MEIENRVLRILAEINDEITKYQGDNLYKDGLLDSIQVVELVVQLEEEFSIEIDPELVIVENFSNQNTIIEFIKNIMETQNAE